jgi:hypothetical protein
MIYLSPTQLHVSFPAFLAALLKEASSFSILLRDDGCIGLGVRVSKLFNWEIQRIVIDVF